MNRLSLLLLVTLMASCRTSEKTIETLHSSKLNTIDVSNVLMNNTDSIIQRLTNNERLNVEVIERFYSRPDSTGKQYIESEKKTTIVNEKATEQSNDRVITSNFQRSDMVVVESIVSDSMRLNELKTPSIGNESKKLGNTITKVIIMIIILLATVYFIMLKK